MAESAISSVLITLGSVVIGETKFFKGVPDQVEPIKRELRSMQGFLRDVDLKHRKGDNSATILVQEIRDVAYELRMLLSRSIGCKDRLIRRKRRKGLELQYQGMHMYLVF
ncbi:hypothetical protein LUZ60_008298 [Juncus effusus]|nr:hypothetical protein LUZ60_008298 [Juncus effusus]